MKEPDFYSMPDGSVVVLNALPERVKMTDGSWREATHDPDDARRVRKAGVRLPPPIKQGRR